MDNRVNEDESDPRSADPSAETNFLSLISALCPRVTDIDHLTVDDKITELNVPEN